MHDFKERHRLGDTPWDLGKPDSNLIKTVEEKGISPCKVLDVGCGTGSDSIWLAKQGFEVTGIDISEIPINKAIEASAKENVKCEFLVANILKSNLNSTFDFVFDRGCFHIFDLENRKLFAKKVFSYLESNGIWLSIIGSPGVPRDIGPPQLTENNITKSVEDYFEIVSLTHGFFEGVTSTGARAWVCLMKKHHLDER